MKYITVKSIGGSIWSFRIDRIELVCKRFKFKPEALKNVPELNGRESCAVIKLIGSTTEYYCQDTYESIMEKINQEE